MTNLELESRILEILRRGPADRDEVVACLNLDRFRAPVQPIDVLDALIHLRENGEAVVRMVYSLADAAADVPKKGVAAR